MKKALPTGTKTYLAGLVFVLIFSFAVIAQKQTPPAKPTGRPTPNAALPKVKQIDEAGLKTALKPNGKPLLVNFWATWCDPCREEFPELVQIDTAYKGKIDFITISLDDLAEINRDVPKFLSDMKAEMPAYLLKVADEGAAISTIAKDWNGGLPFTVLYNAKGEVAYLRQGKVKVDVVNAEIDKLLPAPTTTAFEKGKIEAQKDIANGILSFKTNRIYRHTNPVITQLKEKYSIMINSPEYTGTPNNIQNHYREFFDFMTGYNSVSGAEIEKKFGVSVVNDLNRSFAPIMIFANVDEITLRVNYKS
jgi:thiol-disulfide isomerase/thioredoxin